MFYYYYYFVILIFLKILMRFWLYSSVHFIGNGGSGLISFTLVFICAENRKNDAFHTFNCSRFWTRLTPVIFLLKWGKVNQSIKTHLSSLTKSFFELIEFHPTSKFFNSILNFWQINSISTKSDIISDLDKEEIDSDKNGVTLSLATKISACMFHVLGISSN